MDTLLNICLSAPASSILCNPRKSFSKSLSLKLRLAITLTAISTLCIASENIIDKSDTTDLFIQFNSGNYQQPFAQDLDNFIRQLNAQSINDQIILTGKSQSRTSLASQQLALTRAKIIKKILVKKGIPPTRIKLTGDFKNFKADGKLANGVNASFSPSAVAADTKGLTSKPSSKTLPKLTQLAFVEFLPSQYSQSAPNELTRLSKKMVDTSKTRKLTLLGISQSKTNLATKALALQRAQIVADSLIADGFKAEQLTLDAKITNTVDSNYLIHGVYVYAQTSSEDQTVVNIEKQITPNTSKILNQQQSLNQVFERINNKPSASDKASSIAPNSLCAEFEIKKGSLKTNIQREIGHCDYLMGEWNFGAEEEYIDWTIPIAYKVNVDKGIFGILEIIETNYKIRAHVHQLDRSIDFLPSIQYEKGQ